MYRKKVRHVDTTHRDMKIKKHEAQQERDTGVRGSPDPWATSTKLSHPVTFISIKITICNIIVAVLYFLLVSQTDLPKISLLCS